MSELKDKAHCTWCHRQAWECECPEDKKVWKILISDAEAEIENTIADVNAEYSRRTENEMNRLRKEVKELRGLLSKSLALLSEWSRREQSDIIGETDPMVLLAQTESHIKKLKQDEKD